MTADSFPPVAEPDVLDSSAAGGLLIRGGVLRVLSYVSVVVLSIAPVALLTRHLGQVRFSDYTTAISLVSIVTVVTDAGMSNLGTREYAVRHGSDRDQFMRDLLGLRVALTLVGVLLTALFAVCAGYDTALVLGIVLASLAIVALVAQHTLTIALAAELRLGATSALDLGRQALTTLGLVALVLAGAGVLPLLALPLAVYLLLVPITARVVRGAVSLRMGVNLRRWRALIGPTIAFSLASAVGTIYVYTAQIITSLVTSGNQSGDFSVSFRVYLALATVPGLIVGGALPLLARAARDDRQRLSYALQRIFEVSLVCGIATGLSVFAGAPFIVEVVAGSHYHGAVDVLRIQGFAMIASFLIAAWGYALVSIKRYWALAVINGVALIVSGVLTATLAHADGASGAAIATLAGESALALGYGAVLARDHPELRPRLTEVPRIALASAPAAAVAIWLPGPSVLRAVAVLAVFSVSVLGLHALPPEVREMLPPARPRARMDDAQEEA
jgi:O-antigen/teichoic acid export membrane protein